MRIFRKDIFIVVSVILCMLAFDVATYAETTYDYYPESGNIMRKYDDNGNVYEYKDEDLFPDDPWTNFGRLILAYENGVYKTWDWDTLSADGQVIVKEYTGTYNPVLNSPIWSGVKAEELGVRYEYDHKGEINVTTNSWIERSKSVYDVGGVNITSKYLRNEAGYLIKEIDTNANMYYLYEYHVDLGYEDTIRYKYGYTYLDPQEGDILDGLDTGTLAVTYEYNTLGVLIDMTDSTAEYSYYADTGRMRSKTLLIFDGNPVGTVYEYSDDAVFNVGELNEHGYLTRQTNPDDTYSIFTDYWSSSQPRYVSEYTSGNILVRTSEYDGEGELVEISEADVVYTFYASGRIATKTESGIIYEYTDEDYLGEGYGRLVRETQIDGTSKTFSDYFAGTRQAGYTSNYDADGNFLNIYEYNVSGNLISQISLNGTVTEYDEISERISKVVVPSSNFIAGINLPWQFYGHDVGSQFVEKGFSVTENKLALMAFMEDFPGDAIRVFLFTDLKDTVDFSGSILAFYDEEKLYADMDALLDVASITGTQIIPTLFDYLLGRDTGHSEVIQDADKRAELMTLLGTFIDHYKDRPEILMWDVINEPYHGTDVSDGEVSVAEMTTFISDVIDVVRTNDPGTDITIGFAEKEFLAVDTGYWNSFIDGEGSDDIDIIQIHYWAQCYDADFDELSFSVDNPLFEGLPVIMGEIDPRYYDANDPDAVERLNLLYESGYIGGLFWQDGMSPVGGDIQLIEEDMAALLNWVYGTVYMYTDEDYLGEGYGLLIKEIAPDGTYKTFTDYFAGTRQPQYIAEYTALDILVITYEYDVDGNLVNQVDGDGTEYTYFTDSERMETKTMPDGTIYE
ncbi:MAG: hypothetical protein KAI70_06090, partial [Candidatus Omnitrophica bacterium]|nr:hypothetical protein [Candidatus Omnitrophota bacterium]